MTVCLYYFVYIKMSKTGKSTHIESGSLVDRERGKRGRNDFRKGKGFEQYWFCLQDYENVINFKGGEGFTSL